MTEVDQLTARIREIDERIADAKTRQAELRDSYWQVAPRSSEEKAVVAKLTNIAHEIEELALARVAAVANYQDATRADRQAAVAAHVAARAELRKRARAAFRGMATHLQALDAACRTLVSIGEEDHGHRSDLESLAAQDGALVLPEEALHIALRSLASQGGSADYYAATARAVEDAEDEVAAAIENRVSHRSAANAAFWDDWSRRNREAKADAIAHPNPPDGMGDPMSTTRANRKRPDPASLSDDAFGRPAPKPGKGSRS